MRINNLLSYCLCVLCILGASLDLHGQYFEDFSQQLSFQGAKGQSMDVKAADIDKDGDLDIILANEGQANSILLNDGQGNFSKSTTANLSVTNHDSEDVIAADFNGDGSLDLIFCSEDDVNLGRNQVHEYYLGNGQGSFSWASFRFPDTEANAVITTDIDGDGIADVLFGNTGSIGAFIGVGDGTFTAEGPMRFPQLSRTTQDLLALDVDQDGDIDIFEANEDGNVLYINDSTGRFTDQSFFRIPLPNVETRKASAADVDGDGDLDIFLSNVAFNPTKDRQNRLFINLGQGKFVDETAQRIPVDNDHTVDAIFEDLDLDGDLDIVVANVFGGEIKVYANNGSGVFEDKSAQFLPQTYVVDALGIIAADLNGDGFRDLYICDRNNGSNRRDVLLLRKPIGNSIDADQAIIRPIYPNPVTSGFQLELERTLQVDLSLLDMTGKELLQLGSYKSRIISVQAKQLAHLPKGTYWIRIKLKKGFVHQKIMIA